MRREGDISKIKNQRNNELLKNISTIRKNTLSYYSEAYRYKLRDFPKLSDSEFLKFRQKVKKNKHIRILKQVILLILLIIIAVLFVFLL